MEAELCPDNFVKLKPDRFLELDNFLKIFKNCDSCFNSTNEKSHQIYCCKSNPEEVPSPQKAHLFFPVAPIFFLSPEFSPSTEVVRLFF